MSKSCTFTYIRQLIFFYETSIIGGRGEKTLGIRMQAAIRRKRDYWNTTTIRKGDYGRHCMCVLYAVWVGGGTMTTMMTQVSINLVLFLSSWVKCCIFSNFLSLLGIFWRWSSHMSLKSAHNYSWNGDSFSWLRLSCCCMCTQSRGIIHTSKSLSPNESSSSLPSQNKKLERVTILLPNTVLGHAFLGIWVERK